MGAAAAGRGWGDGEAAALEQGLRLYGRDLRWVLSWLLQPEGSGLLDPSMIEQNSLSHEFF